MCNRFGGCRGGGPPPPWLTQTLWVGGSGSQPPGSTGGGGRWVPQHTPQKDPHDTLILLNIHNWGKRNFQKKFPINSGSHQPRSDPEIGSGSKSFFVLFIHF